MASLRVIASALLVGASVASPLGAQILPVRQYKAGTAVPSMATGDLNRDGLTDIVCGSHFYNPILSVLLRDEAGGFLPATTYDADGGANDLALGDLNGDGLLDVVSTSGTAGSLSARLGDGTGGFGPESVYHGIQLNPLLAADFDGDGDDDVAGCDGSNDGVLILLSDDAGGLVVSGLHPVGDSPVSIAAADFDLDGALDLITANHPSSFSVLLGDGVGGFAPAFPLASPGQANYVITGDVDEDGDADAIAVTSGGELLFLGNGDGSFALAPSFSLDGGGPILADADGDGFDDLLSIGSAGILVQLGQLGPAFDAPLAPVILTHPGYGRLALLEADGDGWPDLVIGGVSEHSVTVSVLPNLGFGVFETFEQVTVEGGNPSAIELADLDGDRDIDAAVACFGYFEDAGVSVLLNDGTGELVPSSHTLTNGRVDIDSGDVDADGDVDLVSISQFNVELQLGDGSGAFPLVTSFAPLPQPQCVRLGDFDGDGDDDAAVAHGSNSAGAVAVLLADGAGGFSAPVSYPLGAAKPTALAVGHLDLDGRLDLVVGATKADWVAVLLGDGAGGFSAPTFVPVPDAPTGVAIGDVTADGRPDLVIGHNTVAPVDVVSVHPGNGAGGLLPAQIWPAGDALGMVEITDLDADGSADVVATEFLQGGSLILLLGQASGGFQTPHVHAAGYRPLDVALADIDGDGRTDALPLSVNIDFATGKITVLRNLGVPEPWTSVGLGLPGSEGIPMLVGHGSLQGGEPVTLALAGARPVSFATLVVGVAPLFAPLKGGVLVPRPDFLFALATNGAGAIHLAANWPPGVPAGFPSWYQVWVADPTAIMGHAASNGVKGIAP